VAALPPRRRGLAVGCAVCAWSAVRGCRDTGAPARPSTTWKITASWWIDPRTQGPGYHEAGNCHVIAGPASRSSPDAGRWPYRGGQRSGQDPGI